MKIGRIVAGVALVAGGLAVTACSSEEEKPSDARRGWGEHQLQEWEGKPSAPSVHCAKPRNKGFVTNACHDEKELRSKAQATCANFVDFRVLNADECPQSGHSGPSGGGGVDTSCGGGEVGNGAAFVCCDEPPPPPSQCRTGRIVINACWPGDDLIRAGKADCDTDLRELRDYKLVDSCGPDSKLFSGLEYACCSSDPPPPSSCVSIKAGFDGICRSRADLAASLHDQCKKQGLELSYDKPVDPCDAAEPPTTFQGAYGQCCKPPPPPPSSACEWQDLVLPEGACETVEQLRGSATLTCAKTGRTVRSFGPASFECPTAGPAPTYSSAKYECCIEPTPAGK